MNNDRDSDNDTLSVKPGSLSTPANGTVSINPDGTVKYTPNPNFNGTDSFTYVVQDGNGGEDNATVTVTVSPVNDAPVANDDNTTTQQDTPVDIDVLANDSDEDNDTLSVKSGSLSTPANGTVSINPDGTVKYTPNQNFVGTDTFTYVVQDGNGGEDNATVTVVVEPALPDYEVTLTLNKSIYINDPGVFNGLIRFTELLHGVNSGDVVLAILKNDKLSVSFNPNLVTMSGKILSNSEWQLEETDAFYKLRYVGTDSKYPKYTRMYLGITGVFTPPSGKKGKFPLKVILMNGSGDTNPLNNQDIETINYRNDN